MERLKGKLGVHSLGVHFGWRGGMLWTRGGGLAWKREIRATFRCLRFLSLQSGAYDRLDIMGSRFSELITWSRGSPEEGAGRGVSPPRQGEWLWRKHIPRIGV